MIDLLQPFLGQPIIEAIGFTFLHTIWQGTLLAFLLFLCLQSMSTKHSRSRYTLSYITLLSMLIVSIGTFAYYYEPLAVNNESVVITEAVMNSGIEISSANLWDRINAFVAPAFPAIFFCWIVGMILYSVRIGLGSLAIIRIKNNRMPVHQSMEAAFHKIKSKIGIRQPVHFGTSPWINVPMTVGWLKPMVLLPVAMINQLSVTQLEAVLAHELAHVKRHDYLQNIIQSLIEAVFYFHPAIWYVSNQIRKERENCCDDMALSACGSKLDYAKVLVRLEETTQGRTPLLAMPFFRKKKELINRIERILNLSSKKSHTMEKLIATTFCLLCFAILTLSSTFKFTQEPSIVLAVEPDVVEEWELPEVVMVWSDELAVQHVKAAQEIEVAQVVEKVRTAEIATLQHQIRQVARLDTLPKNGQQRSFSHSSQTNNGQTITKISKYTDDQKIELEMRGDEIVRLKIDGQEIAKEEMEVYNDQVQDLINESQESELHRQKHREQRMEMRDNQRRELIEERNHYNHQRIKEQLKEQYGDYLHNSEELKEESRQLMEQLKDLKNYEGKVFDFDARNQFEFRTDGDGPEHIILKGNAFVWPDSNFMIADTIIYNALKKSQEYMKDFDQYQFWGNLDSLNSIQSFDFDFPNQKIEDLYFQPGQSGRSLERTHPLHLHGQKESPIIEQMTRDGLVEKNGNYSIQLSQKRLKIDGEKMPSNIHRKYLKIYEDINGHSMNKNDRVTLENRSKQRL